MKPDLHYLELTLPTLAENLALDEALLLAAEHGGPTVLRIWEWPTPAVVLGAACRLEHDVRVSACARDAVPIARRSSGGGTVLLDAGCLLYSLVLRYDTAPELRDVTSSYRWILNSICAALLSPTPNAEKGEPRASATGEIPSESDVTPVADAPGSPKTAPYQQSQGGLRGSQPGIAGISDLTLCDRKFSGNAQQRKRDHVLHHGSILYAFDRRQISQYLHAPERQPEYRQQREHADFVTNLAMPREDIVQRLRACWHAAVELADWPATLVRELVADKYGLDSWTRRR